MPTLHFKHFQEKVHSHRYEEVDENGNSIKPGVLGSLYVQKSAMPRAEKLVVMIEPEG